MKSNQKLDIFLFNSRAICPLFSNTHFSGVRYHGTRGYVVGKKDQTRGYCA